MENSTTINGIPCNAKSLLAYAMGLLVKLDSGELNNQQAIARCKVLAQINSVYKNEIEMAKVKCLIEATNTKFKSNVEMREIESKPFDNTVTANLSNLRLH